MIAFEDVKKESVTSSARIKVIGIGGAGNNTLNSMIKKEYDTNINLLQQILMRRHLKPRWLK